MTEQTPLPEWMKAIVPYQSKLPLLQTLLPSLYVTLTKKIEHFKIGSSKVFDTPDGPLIWYDRGPEVKLLAVGHMDAVRMTDQPLYNSNTGVVNAIQLDDRLGIWTLFNVIPLLTNVKFDILLTDKEEVSKSTAKHMTAEWWAEMGKDYNWMFEMDRGGTDVVMYQYQDEAKKAMLVEQGWEVGQGSFTDIAALDSYGIAGINFGVGYRDWHKDECTANLWTVFQQCCKVARFIDTYHDLKLEHVQTPENKYQSKSYTSYSTTNTPMVLGRAWQGESTATAGSSSTQGIRKTGSTSEDFRDTALAAVFEYLPDQDAYKSVLTGLLVTRDEVAEYARKMFRSNHYWDPVTDHIREMYWNNRFQASLFSYTKKERKTLRKICEERQSSVGIHVLKGLHYYLATIPWQILRRFERYQEILEAARIRDLQRASPHIVIVETAEYKKVKKAIEVSKRHSKPPAGTQMDEILVKPQLYIPGQSPASLVDAVRAAEVRRQTRLLMLNDEIGKTDEEIALDEAFLEQIYDGESPNPPKEPYGP